MTKPRLLELFCCAGGAGKGYADAGFEVVGVDIDDQPRYPFTFVQEDAIWYLKQYLRSGWWERFDVAHASPPCQKHSALTKGTNKGLVYDDFLAETRELLNETGLPYVIENVAGAPLRKDLMLCGEMFGLQVLRHRYFEFGGGGLLHHASSTRSIGAGSPGCVTGSGTRVRTSRSTVTAGARAP